MRQPRFSGRAFALVLLSVLAITLGPRVAEAHPQAVSGMSIDIGKSRLRVKQDLHGLTLVDVMDVDKNDNEVLDPAEFEAARDRILDYVERHLRIVNAGAACTAEAPIRFALARGYKLVLIRDYRCPGELGTLTIDNTIFMEDRGGHKHVTSFLLGSVAQHYTFVEGATRYQLDASRAPNEPGGKITKSAGGANQSSAKSKPDKPPSSLMWWVRDGLRHILSGADHLLFVLVLLVAVRSFRELAWVISSFTLGHSLTLALGTLGLVQVDSRIVESLIAASIVYVALENVLRLKPPRSRPVLTLGFGLLHGLGFAGRLTSMGLPSSDLIWPLLGFNLGVELGQLAVVAPAFPALAWAERKHPATHRQIRRGLSATVAVLALGWVVERALGLRFMPIG